MNEQTGFLPSRLLSGNFDFDFGLGLPTLPLPRNTWTGSFVESKLIDKKTLKTTAMLPVVDSIISDYGSQYLRVRFTIRFIEFINQKFMLYQFGLPGQRIPYALEVSRKLNQYSIMEIDPNEEKTRETLNYYLGNQLFLVNTSNIRLLTDYGVNLAAGFLQKLAQIEYVTANQRKKLLPEQARDFITDCQKTIEKHLDEMFQSLNSKTAAVQPDTSSVKLPAGLIAVNAASLKKINPSLPPSRADDLAPYLNQAIAEAQISTLVGEAMFLAQLLHEMGIKTDLNEGGGKKRYEGKVYDYFFFMYDKESPAANRRKVALALGNDQPGDGVRYHGRGYIQLTGKTNYTSAGTYLNLDLVNTPDLANDPQNSVRIAAWFWRFGNGNLNNFTDKDSETNFQTVTTRINGGLTNYQERLTLYKNAKKQFGIK